MTGAGGHTSGTVANDKVVDGHSRLQFSTLLDMTWNKTDTTTHPVEKHSNFFLMHNIATQNGFLPRLLLKQSSCSLFLSS